MKQLILKSALLLTSLVVASLNACNSDDSGSAVEIPEEMELEFSTNIPAGSNSWVVDNLAADATMISDQGIHNWTETELVIRSYFHLSSAGKLNIGLNAKSPDGQTMIKVTLGKSSKEVELSSTDYDKIDVGVFDAVAGYNFIDIQAVSKTGAFVGDINDILVGGTAAEGQVSFVPTENFHFGRRGPSDHLTYAVPEVAEIRYFYNEIMVPEGQDVQGSFFMSNGHSEGYFGIQVNSETERRVLFSIWSAFDTNDPNQIPSDFKVLNLGHGADVTVQDFGNEGSGLQSFKRVDWQAGKTYKFLSKVEPSVNESTDYTGWFFDPEIGDWQLIASMRRPKTSTFLNRPYSFLENFITSTGNRSRSAQYMNQWMYGTNDRWYELTEAQFTVDGTANSGHRLDYAGGVDNGQFFLKNCGFFDENVEAGSVFNRPSANNMPEIDFDALEQPSIPEEVDLIDRSKWSILAISSEETSGEGETGRANDVLDNDLSTYWHSCWTGDCSEAAYPHMLTIDMGEQTEIRGLQFNQRNGSRTVSKLGIEISNDNENWTDLGTYSLTSGSSNQNSLFESTQNARYLRINMQEAHDGQRFAAMAEIKGISPN